ncbi:interleukin enhancer-binding factor 3-like [Athalia rosae]|uniref:interleukin enhancer-binding factor 3-like n=1 Tax=Athalia rosae TaxID=37344 RepID=UPI002034704C|nr:interleukin enhancer-binding factor 3-like [Athalia rosae]
MHTRSRNSQSYSTARGPSGNSNTGPGFQSTAYQTQGNFQPTQMSGPNQLGTYKSVPPLNVSQFKSNGPQLLQQLQQQNRLLPVPKTPPILQQSSNSGGQSLQQTTPATQAPRLKPILKQTTAFVPAVSSVPAATNPATATPQVTSPTPPTNNVESKVMEEKEIIEVENQEQPKWKRNRVPGYKVNKKLKRLRMNQRLRRALQPKNAIMVLNEMKTGVQFTFPESQAAMPNSLFVVHAEIDGKTYVGQGLSKPLARQNAAENALKCLLLEKMTTASSKARIDAELDGQSAIQEDLSQSVSAKEEGSEVTAVPSSEQASDEPDEVPWSSLASFALYKLFLEWQNQGTVVPVPRPGVSPGRAKKEPKAPIQKDLPPNAINIHPVMLLNQMKPGLAYVEVNRVGNPPNTMFTLAVEIDGIDYNGTAKNKKDAKKMAAKTALTALYGLVYPEEASMDHTEDIMMC